ncbi:RNA polymerase sigma factor [Kutzneria sp. NPDC052558]|uniref:RNA polymerase sigma factor n=1 Tax=Kutzneria sp. NPDC052558 TaxID=3364121 RepID=UPI0037C8BAB6
MSDIGWPGLVREFAPQVLGALVRGYGTFDIAEDAVQEALLAATVQWPAEGVPDNPRAWLFTVATRRMTDLLRSEHARRRREDTEAAMRPSDWELAPPPAQHRDDTLTLLFLCCHPALAVPGQIALTLRAVGGLTTAQIAHAFLVSETTMAQRISRAKSRIRSSRLPFRLPAPDSWAQRLGVVLRVLYLIFNEGHTATSGHDLHQAGLTGEAIRLAADLHRHLPDDGEVTGLLALMLLTDARRPARTTPDGGLVPLGEQDRGRWNRDYIAEGLALITDALARRRLGPYQLQAAIAAVHAEAPRVEDTDWPQILGLYELLSQRAPSPVVTLNHAVALAVVRGPRAGLDLLAPLEADTRLAHHHRLAAVRAHLLEMAGDPAAAHADYLLAARQTDSLPEQRYLESRASRLP